jgi:hypothetical protein
MLTKWFHTVFNPRITVLLATACLLTTASLTPAFCGTASAQDVSFALLRPRSLEPVPMTTTTAKPASIPEVSRHRFWDRENSFLFTANAAFSAADFVVTRNNLQNGGQELNPITRVFAGSTAGLAANFAGETAGVIGVSYFLHRTGHHKLERVISVLNLGSSASAVGFGLAHR